MAAQQQQQQEPSYPHLWSGAGKTLDALLQESEAFRDGLPQDERNDRQKGKHFNSMADVWGVAGHRLVPGDFSSIQRTRAQGAMYASCLDHIGEEIGDPADRTSAGTANQQGNNEKVDPVGNLGAQSAHLLSRAKVGHRAYPFLAEAAIGVRMEDDYPNLPGHVSTNRRKLLVGVKGGQHCTSLKGHKFNKMYWKLQEEHFDSEEPAVLVVPLLPMEEILNWTSSPAHAVDYDVAVLTFGRKHRVVAKETLQEAKGTCTPPEIDLARENLACFVKGIASHLLTEDVFESLPKKYFTSKNPSLLRWKSLVERLRGMDRPSVSIPTQLPLGSHVRVAKARMTTGTSLPDPWLLLAKSAINYSASNGQQLMPACPPPESGSDSDDSSEDFNSYQDHEHYTGGNEEEPMDDVRAQFYHGALRRAGFGFDCAEGDLGKAKPL